MTAPETKVTGLRRLIVATRYSLQGLKHGLRGEPSFRQEVALTIILLPLALWLGSTGVERALLVGSVLLVLVAELLNSAVEAAVDRFGRELHVLSGRAKDLGSAAVFLSLINWAAVWALILLD